MIPQDGDRWPVATARVKEEPISESGNKEWFVYILRCGNGAFYTGVTTDVQRRLAEHADGGRQSARYTRAFAPVELVYSCRLGGKKPAYRVEYRLKRLSRKEKAMVVANNFSKKALLNYLGIDQ